MDMATLVIDNGSGMCKAGLVGDLIAPRAVFPSVIDRPLPTEKMSNSKYSFANKAIAKRLYMKLSYPIERGMVTNWDDMELLWDHTFKHQVGVNPSEHPILFTEVSLNAHSSRDKLAQVMFEKYNIPGMCVANSGYAALAGLGDSTGIVLDSGHGVTQVVPIFEGHCLSYGILRINFGGSDLTDYLQRLLNAQGHCLNSSYEKDVIQEIKEKLCFVATNSTELEQDMQTTYEFPNGKSIPIGEERTLCTEPLFDLEYVGITRYSSLAEMVVKSIDKCDKVIRKDLYSNIVLSGGCTMLPGFVERFTQQIKTLAPAHMLIKVNALPQRNYLVWLGGAHLASQFFFKDEFVSKKEYNESGSSAVQRKWSYL